MVQCKSMGIWDKWEGVLDMYRDVNNLFGDIVKVFGYWLVSLSFTTAPTLAFVRENICMHVYMCLLYFSKKILHGGARPAPRLRLWLAGCPK